MKNILVINGPNLNLLGEREPEIYGTLTLAEINRQLKGAAKTMASPIGVSLRFFQSNSEGSLIDKIHRDRRWAHGILINPGAYTHYSIAIRDALKATGLPVVEVHLSKIDKREPFRKISVIKDICVATFYGKKEKSYLEGLSFLADYLAKSPP